MKSLIFAVFILMCVKSALAKRETPYLRNLHSQANIIGIAYASNIDELPGDMIKINLLFLSLLKGLKTEELVVIRPKYVSVDDPQIKHGELKLVFIEIRSGKPSLLHASPVTDFKINLKQVKCSPTTSCGDLSLGEITDKVK